MARSMDVTTASPEENGCTGATSPPSLVIINLLASWLPRGEVGGVGESERREDEEYANSNGECLLEAVYGWGGEEEGAEGCDGEETHIRVLGRCWNC